MEMKKSRASKVADADLKRQAQKYLTALLENLRNRYPQAHLLSLLGLLDPRNVDKANPSLILELASTMGMDGHKLWNEFLAYHFLASSLTPQSLECALTVMWKSDNRQTMLAAYPLITSLLARIAVLPASSAEMERVFLL